MAAVTLREITADTVREILGRVAEARAARGARGRIWRFMIDARYQGQGFGAEALRQVIEHVRRKGVAKPLSVSYVPGDGCPEPFYLQAGFRHTGRMDEGEVVLECP